MAAKTNIALTVRGSNGASLATPLSIGFPAAGIIVTQLSPTQVYGNVTCNSQIQVIASSSIFYVAESVATIMTAING